MAGKIGDQTLRYPHIYLMFIREIGRCRVTSQKAGAGR
jgi:hypothetical protein